MVIIIPTMLVVANTAKNIDCRTNAGRAVNLKLKVIKTTEKEKQSHGLKELLFCMILPTSKGLA